MKAFIKNIFLKNRPESSKRFFGGIGMVACIFVICIWQQIYIRELLYTCAALLGLGIADSLTAKIKEK